MTISKRAEPLVHVETCDGCFVGAISHRLGVPKQEKSWSREVESFCGKAIASGSTITTFYSLEEYRAFIKDMPMWKPADDRQGVLP